MLSPSLRTAFDRMMTELRQIMIPAIAIHYKSALVVAEDHRFWRHAGVDFLAILRASVRNIFSGHQEGASTIHQQLVRVTTGRYERTLRRKLRELLFASQLESYFSKDEILSIYLLRGYYGWQMVGLLAACKRLGLTTREASHRDAARLVARIRYPERRFQSASWATRINRREKHILLRWRRLVVAKRTDFNGSHEAMLGAREASRSQLEEP